MNPQTMDPADILTALEGHQDILSPRLREEDEFIRRTRCPRCQEDSPRREIDPKRPFAPGELLARFDLRCTRCNCLFEPYTKVILEAPVSAR